MCNMKEGCQTNGFDGVEIICPEKSAKYVTLFSSRKEITKNKYITTIDQRQRKVSLHGRAISSSLNIKKTALSRGSHFVTFRLSELKKV